ncbi:MAG TPA: lytic transglycosylase domain-containing protein [Victivallales bacterium]|nr:lytic transglycosylase domain-containing protein [Victivallales bacterium]
MYRPKSERKRIKRNKVGCAVIILIIIISYLVYSHWSSQNYNNRFNTLIIQAAKRNSLDPNLIKAVIWRESNFNDKAVGKNGEIGLMQITPSTAVKDWAVENKRGIPNDGMLFKPATNIEIGSWYLARCKKHWNKYKNSLDLTLAEYNAGYSNARKWVPKKNNGNVLPNITFPSTKEYIKAIIEQYDSYKSSNTFN